METFKRLIDVFTLGSDRPIRRLLAYYAVLAVIVGILFQFVPFFDRLFAGEHMQAVTQGPQLLQDAIKGAKDQIPEISAGSRLDLALTTILIMASTLALMLPVSWVFMSVRRMRDFNQGVAQTLIILPIVVAGIVLVVRTSLALAFSLAGIVAGLRFRTTMRDVRDTAYIFLGIGVGVAAGVQSLTVAAVLSITFNFVALLIWRYDFGRNALEPTAASQWAEPLGDLADKGATGGAIPDRDLVLALSPNDAAVLAKRFSRVHKILGPTPRKPRFNAILSVSTDTLTVAQNRIEAVLDGLARRWKLDQVITNEGKPSELYYLLRVRKSVSRDSVLTAIRHSAGDSIISADLEISDVAQHVHRTAK
ncbi:MAG TPA: DUF4956 domain-containing protein [Gemmatimonadales bacterium]|jgi:hypothetical protein